MCDLKFKDRRFPPRVGALDAVEVRFVFEFEGDLCTLNFGVGVNNAVVGFAGAAKKDPGEGVEKTGFSRPVGSGDAGEVEGGEVDSNGGAVGEEAGEGEGAGDHGVDFNTLGRFLPRKARRKQAFLKVTFWQLKLHQGLRSRPLATDYNLRRFCYGGCDLSRQTLRKA